MLTTQVTVRPVRQADRTPLATMLARAFFDDPVTAWFYPRERTRLRHARTFFSIKLRQLGGHGELLTTEDLAGAALWALPGHWREDHDVLRYLPTVPAILPRLPQCLRAMRLIEENHPAEPHLYLSVLGTAPDRQGQGIGSALLRPTLTRADKDQVPCYLESSKEANVPFYERHGFAVHKRIEFPNGGPSLWLMWRDPR